MPTTRRHDVDFVWRSPSTPSGIWAIPRTIMPGMESTRRYGAHTTFSQTDVNWRNAASSSSSPLILKRRLFKDHRQNRSQHSPAVHLKLEPGKIRSPTLVEGKRVEIGINPRSDLGIGGRAVVRRSTTSAVCTCRVHLSASLLWTTSRRKEICMISCSSSTNTSRPNRMF